MGVFRLSSWLYSEHSDCCYPLTSRGGNFPYLFVDGNALLHPLCSFVFGYGEYTTPVKQGFEDCVKHVAYLFLQEVERYAKALRSKNVILAFDGVAPIAKQYQQRCRRFFSCSGNGFDSSYISPGTPFTKLLYTELNKQKDWIILYGNGEGEHKIIKYIRKNNISNGCILGPDGDLIFLTILLKQKVTLLRQGTFVIVEKLKSKIPNVNFLVFLSFILGNDFLPRLKMFFSLQNGMNILNDLPLVKIDKSINIPDCINFFKTLSKYEENFVSMQAFVLTDEREDKLLNTNRRKGEHWFKSFRKEYNLKHFNGCEKYACHDYIKTIIWNWSYYNDTAINFTQFYPYSYPPLVYDLAKVTKQKFYLKPSTFVSEKAQLLLILPKNIILEIMPECEKFIKMYSKYYDFTPIKYLEGLECEYEYRTNIEMPPVSAAEKFIKSLE